MRVPKLRTLLKNNTGKFLILTISLHVIVYYVLLFLRPIIPEESRQVIFLTNDFKDSFLVAVQRFWENPTTMYTLNPLITYRNLPATILYYSIFYFLPVPGWHYKLIAFSTCTLAWTMGCCVLISKIMDTKQFQRMKVSHTLIGDKYFIISLFLLCPFHAGEYIIGNTDTITCFFVLAGVYYLLKGAPHLAIFYWGIGAMFKITVVILVVFFIITATFK
ncbi:DUF2029 domain-containing protein, partial [Candidatus Bathyarchaeota archaeon]|nr:DUF2029 domain-containing protein [Candidatus Bathyarchaeota archaeon]